MSNCKFCFRPVPSDCYALIRGRLSGTEFHVEDIAEFMCDECVDKLEKIEEIATNQLQIGDILFVGEE